jgi:hypothetical protein
MTDDGLKALIDNINKIGPLISGGLGLLGTLITLSINWAQGRTASARRQHLLEEEIKRLTFWDTWLKIQTSAATSDSEKAELKRRVLDEASAASANVKEAFQRQTGKLQLTGKQVLAVVLSSFMPGLGQFYNADYKKGAVMLVAYLLCTGLSSLSSMPVIRLLVVLLFVIWSTLDAYRVSSGKARRW